MQESVMSKIKEDAEGKYLLTNAQVELIAKKVSETFKIPFLKGEAYTIVIAKIIRKVDAALYKILPNEIYDFINSLNDGFSDEEIETVKRRIIELVNRLIDIPFLSEDMEAMLIKMILDIIIDCLRKGKILK
jgi:hypothetical protein